MSDAKTPSVAVMAASELRPFDGITEGSVVIEVCHHEVERYDPATGSVTRHPMVTATLVRAQLEGEDVDGFHLHTISHEPAGERTFDPDETLRVARPGPVAPCSCGFDGTAQNPPSHERH